jgi:hypothetical protein
MTLKLAGRVDWHDLTPEQKSNLKRQSALYSAVYFAQEYGVAGRERRAKRGMDLRVVYAETDKKLADLFGVQCEHTMKRFKMEHDPRLKELRELLKSGKLRYT